MTLAPASASRRTVAAPMPLAPPVTTATRPLRSRSRASGWSVTSAIGILGTPCRRPRWAPVLPRPCPAPGASPDELGARTEARQRRTTGPGVPSGVWVKPASLWEPSQSGLWLDWPHRHSVMRFLASSGAPSLRVTGTPAGDLDRAVGDDGDLGRQVGLVARGPAVDGVGERARGAALDHADHLREHVGLVGVRHHLPHVRDGVRAEAGVDADAAVVPHRQRRSVVALGPLGIGGVGGLGPVEADPRVGAVAEGLAARLPAPAQGVALVRRDRRAGDPGDRLTTLGVDRRPHDEVRGADEVRTVRSHGDGGLVCHGAGRYRCDPLIPRPWLS